MPHTIYIIRRVNRSWWLIAQRGGSQVFVDESTAIGERRARLDFERKHRIVVESIDGALTTEGEQAEAARLDASLAELSSFKAGSDAA